MDKKLRDALITNIKLHLLKSDWKYIDYMLEEVYLYNRDGTDMIIIKPLPTRFATLQFYAINGSFAGDVIDWENVQNNGELIDA